MPRSIGAMTFGKSHSRAVKKVGNFLDFSESRRFYWYFCTGDRLFPS